MDENNAAAFTVFQDPQPGPRQPGQPRAAGKALAGRGGGGNRRTVLGEIGNNGLGSHHHPVRAGKGKGKAGLSVAQEAPSSRLQAPSCPRVPEVVRVNPVVAGAKPSTSSSSCSNGGANPTVRQRRRLPSPSLPLPPPPPAAEEEIEAEPSLPPLPPIAACPPGVTEEDAQEDVSYMDVEDAATAEDDDDEDVDEEAESSALVAALPEEAEREHNAMLDMQEYQADIYSYLRTFELKHVPKWNYMSKQPDITFAMRAILVDWLVEVGEEYRLHCETLHLAINYIDRFLSVMSVQRGKLQLVGTACMFIAAKYEEIYPPDVSEFVYITDDTYSKKQVLRMEHLVLQVLNFDLAVCTQLCFLTQFSRAVASEEDAVFLAQYLSELTLLEAETFLVHRPSHVAAACVALARHTLAIPAWPEAAVQMSGLEVNDFKDCLVELHNTFTKAPDMPQQAIREKYKLSKFLKVAEIAPTPIF